MINPLNGLDDKQRKIYIELYLNTFIERVDELNNMGKDVGTGVMTAYYIYKEIKNIISKSDIKMSNKEQVDKVISILNMFSGK